MLNQMFALNLTLSYTLDAVISKVVKHHLMPTTTLESTY